MAARDPNGKPIDLVENQRRKENGELYWAFTPDLIQQRRKCAAATRKFNTAEDPSRRELVELWKDDTAPLPPAAPTPQDDEALLEEYPWIEPPLKIDYGHNIRLGHNVYINSNSTFIDTCTIAIGSRTLVGPNCSFYSGTHPLDHRVRDGTRGPEGGAPIEIGEDCWLGGNVVVLPGVRIGNGVVVGAGSVVTKDVPSGVVVVGNPARVLKKTIEDGEGMGS